MAAIMFNAYILTAQQAFLTHWIAVDTSSNVARGTLDGIAVTFSGGHLEAGVTNGSFAGFNSCCITPLLTASDMVEFTATASTQSYSVSFGAPVADPILYLHSMASVLTFSTTNIIRLNGDANFVVSGATVRDPTQANADGSIQLRGTYTSFTFTAYYPPGLDGIDIQIGKPQAAEYYWNASWGLLPDQVDNTMRLGIEYPTNMAGYPTNMFGPVLTNGQLVLHTYVLNTNEFDPNYDWMYYMQGPADLGIPAQLVIEAELQFVSGSYARTARPPAGIEFGLTSGVTGLFGVLDGTIYLGRNQTNRWAETNLPTSDAFHLYRIEVASPTVLTQSVNQVRVFQDGVLVLSAPMGGDDFNAGVYVPCAGIAFGDLTGWAYGVSRWRSFRHNAARLPSPPLMSISTSPAEVRWTSHSNTLYNLQYSPNLALTGWTNLATNIVGNGTTNAVPDAFRGITPQGYYRVQMVP